MECGATKGSDERTQASRIEAKKSKPHMVWDDDNERNRKKTYTEMMMDCMYENTLYKKKRCECFDGSLWGFTLVAADAGPRNMRTAL